MVEIEIPLPESFFTEETRSGFTVTKNRKEIWAVELDLLFQLKKMCERYNLKYMLGAGTLLGAVRHKGFIPWDDDIDVYMLREDYDTLLKHAAEFRYPYFLQSGYTDKYYVRRHAQFRNSDTTGYIAADQNLNINKGIFIDIFPIDGISENDEEDHLQDERNRWFDKLWTYYFRESYANLMQRMKKIATMTMLFAPGKAYWYGAMEKNLSCYSKPGTKLWGNRTIHFECPRSRRPLEDYTKLIMAEFEGFQFPIPANYDAMLTQQYGDYMKIPENKPASLHGELTVSTDISYRDYCRN